MLPFATLHKASVAVLSTQTYTPYDYAQPSQVTQRRGVGLQVLKATPEYEIGYHVLPRDTNTFNVFCRTGADGYQQTTGYGNVVARTFLLDVLDFNGAAGDRVYVYQPVSYAVFEHCEYIVNGAVWLFTNELDRATQTIRRIMVQISTDGLVGRTFGVPIQVSSGGVNLTNNFTFVSNLVTDGNGDLWLFFACESPAGLYRIKINSTFDGTFSGYGQVSSVGGGFSESAITAADAPGELICVYRVNSGAYLMMLTSTDYGATWSNAGVSTGLGSSTGVKVQPRILPGANPARLMVAFSDRVPPQIDKVSVLNPKAAAFADSYRAVVALGAGTTNGNGDLVVLDATQNLNFYIACNQAGSNAPNGMSWWAFTDSTATPRRPFT